MLQKEVPTLSYASEHLSHGYILCMPALTIMYTNKAFSMLYPTLYALWSVFTWQLGPECDVAHPEMYTCLLHQPKMKPLLYDHSRYLAE